MRKLRFMKNLSIICVFVLFTTACQPVTKKELQSQQLEKNSTSTEIQIKSYDENLAALDIQLGKLESDLCENISISANITPASMYQNQEIGIYEFTNEGLSMDSEEFINRINEYSGTTVVTVQDAFSSVDSSIDEEVFHKIYCYNYSADYTKDLKTSKEYLSMISALREFGYSLETERKGIYFEKTEKLKNLFQDQFSQIGENGISFMKFETKEDYERVRTAFFTASNTNLEYKKERLFDEWLSFVGKNFYENCIKVSAIEIYETIGEQKIPLNSLRQCSYKNEQGKDLPSTSYESYDNECWTPTDCKITAVFSENLELEWLEVNKRIKVNEEPEYTEKILDARQIIDLFCKQYQSEIAKYKITELKLYYVGRIVETENGLEDYIYPVWWLSFYDGRNGCANCMIIDAVTGEVI